MTIATENTNTEELVDQYENYIDEDEAKNTEIEQIIREIATEDCEQHHRSKHEKKDYVFISYKSDDRNYVYKDIVLPLHKNKCLSVYFDKEFRTKNDNWIIQMQKNIESPRCKAVIAFISKQYFCSYAVMLELMYNRFNINVYLTGKFTPVIPIYIDDGEYDDYFQGSNRNNVGIIHNNIEQKAFLELIKMIKLFEIDSPILSKLVALVDNGLGVTQDLHELFTYTMINEVLNLSNATNHNDWYNKVADIEDIYQTIKDAATSSVFNSHPNFDIYENTLKKYYGNDEVVIIPDHVEIIGVHAFSTNIENKKNIKTVKMSNCVKEIQKCSFKGCTNITEIEMSKNIKTIGDEAFFGCESLQSEIKLPNVCSVGKNAFAGCKNLTKVEFSEQLHVLSEGVFKNCTSLKFYEYFKETTHNPLTKIEANAFLNCKKICKDWFVNNVECDETAFIGCKSYAGKSSNSETEQR